jgi:hypothetical protein
MNVIFILGPRFRCYLPFCHRASKLRKISLKYRETPTQFLHRRFDADLY